MRSLVSDDLGHHVPGTWPRLPLSALKAARPRAQAQAADVQGGKGGTPRLPGAAATDTTCAERSGEKQVCPKTEAPPARLPRSPLKS